MSSDYTQPGQQPQYGQYPQYGGPGGQYGAPPRTNPLAIASLICGIAQLLLGLLAGIPGIILGFVALSQIRTRGEGGRGMAIAGIVLGFVGLAISLILIIAIVASSHSTTNYG
jgi:hypothetical protein